MSKAVHVVRDHREIKMRQTRREAAWKSSRETENTSKEIGRH